MRIEIKPLSVNDAWQGKRYKSKAYKKLCETLPFLLPKNQKYNWLKNAKEVYVYYIFGTRCDWDNPIKPFQDILSAKYGFNDNKIKLGISKVVSPKKEGEFIEFYLFPSEIECLEFALNKTKEDEEF